MDRRQGKIRAVSTGISGLAVFAALLLLLPTVAAAEMPRLEVAGLEIGAVDLENSVELYTQVLGFLPVGDRSPDEVRLANGGFEVTLRQASRPAAIDPDRQAHIYLNLEVRDLAAVASDLDQRGLAFLAPPRETAIGFFAALRDPSGNVLQVVERKPRSPQPFPPRVFNVGIRLESMAAAKGFYCGILGFEVMSENHPPPIIPLKPRGQAPLILFEGVPEKAEAGPEVARTVLVLETADLAAALAALRERGLVTGGEAVVEDTSGNRVRLRQATPPAPPAP